MFSFFSAFFSAFFPVKKAGQTVTVQSDWVKGNTLDIVAKTIWGEARSEGYRGMQAVANVIRNRYLKSQMRVGRVVWWGTSYISICQKKSGNTYQFSCWSASDPNRAKMDAQKPGSSPEFDTALQIARLMIKGQLADITNGADHYYATWIAKPYWAQGQKQIAAVGSHRFYELA